MSHERAIYLRVDQVRRLDHWCRNLNRMFHEMPPTTRVYLVGSVLEGPGFRDVDVRVVLPDGACRRLRAILNEEDLNYLLSRWGQEQTGLPIDCQVQSVSDTDEHSGPRNPRCLT